MQIGYSFIHLFSIHASSCPQDLSAALDPVPTVIFRVLFYFYLMGFLLSSQVSVSTLIAATRQQIIVIIATTQETFSFSHLPSALVCTYFPAVAQSHRRARALVKQQQKKRSQGRNENSEAESSVSSVRVFPARACTRLTDLSGANDKLSPTGELLLTSLISSPTSSVISAVPLLYLVFTHWERLHHLPVSLLRHRRIKALVQNPIRSVQIWPRNATDPTSVPLDLKNSKSAGRVGSPRPDWPVHHMNLHHSGRRRAGNEEPKRQLLPLKSKFCTDIWITLWYVCFLLLTITPFWPSDFVQCVQQTDQQITHTASHTAMRQNNNNNNNQKKKTCRGTARSFVWFILSCSLKRGLN